MKEAWKLISVVLVLLMILAFAGCQTAPEATGETEAEPAEAQEDAADVEEDAADAQEDAAEAPEDTEPAEADEPEDTDGDQPITVGYIMGGPDLWNQSQWDAIEYTCDHYGYEFVALKSDYTSELELSNAEDLIAREVDAIIMFTVNANTGQKVAQLCNEADIPLFLLDGALADGPGTAVSLARYDFYECGKVVGTWVCENMPNAKMACVMGLPGANIIEEYQRGLFEVLTNGVEVVEEQPADWDRAKALAVTENILTGGKEIDVIYAHNEEMAAGVIKALENAGKLDEIAVVSANGSPDGVELLNGGKMVMTVTQSPSYEGVAAVKSVHDYFAGMDVPKEILVPLKAVTIDNIDDMLTWAVDDALLAKVGVE